MASTSFFRGLGGAVGAAVLGAVFAARAGTTAGQVHGLAPAARDAIADGVQTVFLIAAPVCAVAFLLVCLLREVPLER
jgi:hypothetical protein